MADLSEYKRILAQPVPVYPEDQKADEEFYTIGPGINEATFSYSFGTSTHSFNIASRMSPDTVLIYQSKMYGAFRKLGAAPKLLPTERRVKGDMLKVY